MPDDTTADLVAEIEALYQSFPDDVLLYLHDLTTKERLHAIRGKRMAQVGACNGRLAVLTRLLRARGLLP